MAAPRAIVGYRGWSVEDGHLASPHWDAGYTWKPRGFAVAHCRVQHDPGAEDCRCGLYAHYAITHALKKEGSSAAVQVIGAILGWGSTTHHNSGFRCGKARILGFTTAPAKKRSLEQRIATGRELANLYEVPFFPKSKELRKEAERWGETRRPRRPPKPGIATAGFRNCSSQAAMMAQYVGANSNHGLRGGPPWAQGQTPLRFLMGSVPHIPARHLRVEVELDVYPRTEIVQTKDPTTGNDAFWIEGIHARHWDLKVIEVNTEMMEVPLPGSYPRLSAAPGHRRTIITLQGDFELHEVKSGLLDRELRALERVGVPQRVEQAKDPFPYANPSAWRDW